MARAAGVSTAVYGSLAWEYRCSTAYVRADSDVDLLFDAKAAPPLGPVLDLARALSADAGAPRLDGELILPGDSSHGVAGICTPAGGASGQERWWPNPVHASVD